MDWLDEKWSRFSSTGGLIYGLHIKGVTPDIVFTQGRQGQNSRAIKNSLSSYSRDDKSRCMTNLNKLTEQSELIKTVVSLEANFSSLERLSERIGELELDTEFDQSQMRRLLLAFSESATSVSDEFVRLVQLIADAKVRSEEAAKIVAAKAELLQAKQNDEAVKFEAFRELTAKVNQLNEDLKVLQSTTGTEPSVEEKDRLTQELAKFELRLRPLIEEAQVIKKDAQASRLKGLEQNADALGQSLKAASSKLTLIQN